MDNNLIITSLNHAPFVYAGVTDAEYAALTQNHSMLVANGVRYIGTQAAEAALTPKRIMGESGPSTSASTQKIVLTKFDFLSRFTQAERIAIRAAAATNGALFDFMSMLEISGEVQLTNPATISGVQFLETAGLIGPDRAKAILRLE